MCVSSILSCCFLFQSLHQNFEEKADSVQAEFKAISDAVASETDSSSALSANSTGPVLERIEVQSAPTPDCSCSRSVSLLFYPFFQTQQARLMDSVASLEQLAILQEQLKEALSPADFKAVSQRMWTLWQTHGELEHRLSSTATRLKQLVALRQLYLTRYASCTATVIVLG